MSKNQMVRMCTACRSTFSKNELLRVVRVKKDDENSEIIFDPTGKLNGRGAYVCKHPECIARVEKTRMLEKILACKANPDLYENLRKAIKKSDGNALSFLGLAVRAGKISKGESMCEKSIADGSARLVILATDVSDATRKKFRNKTTYYGVGLVEFSTKEELGRLTGNTNRAVLTINDDGMAEGLKKKILDMEVL